MNINLVDGNVCGTKNSNGINGSHTSSQNGSNIKANVDEVVNLMVGDMLELVVSKEKLDNTSKSKGNGKQTEAPKNFSFLGVSQSGRIMDPICLQQNIFSSISAENIAEYQWPPDTSGDYYMLQEQVSTYLGITSFKRKYPEIERRKVEADEVNHLLTSHVISEVQVTLGLTALKSSDVCDMMMKEYPEKYNEYNAALQEREKEKLQNKYKQYASQAASMQVDKSQMPSFVKKAVRQAADYNARLNRQRKDEFAVYYDMQTNVLQYPASKVRKLDPSLTRPSLYPCALIPGQFQEHYKTYTKDELMYLPLNTALYGPPNPSIDHIQLSSDSESDSVSESSSSSSDNQSVGSEKSAKPDKDKLLDVAMKTVDASEDLEGAGKEEPMQVNESEENTEESDEIVCGICSKDGSSNKKGEAEELIKCSQCDNHGHPSCLEMSVEQVSVIETYNWQCMECKTCTICSMPHREDLMMFCDRCDRGYHTFCVSIRAIPSGVWACSRCKHADPNFRKRRRKELKLLSTPSGRGRGRRRRGRGGRMADHRSTVIIDLNDDEKQEEEDEDSSTEKVVSASIGESIATVQDLGDGKIKLTISKSPPPSMPPLEAIKSPKEVPHLKEKLDLDLAVSDDPISKTSFPEKVLLQGIPANEKQPEIQRINSDDLSVGNSPSSQ
uniref:PHD finger protein 10 n=1 Tax=Ciona intestinalis TaxID=7719 RepID=F6WAN9_CIOIN